MTREELFEEFGFTPPNSVTRQLIVKCANPSERAEVLRAIIDLGYNIGPERQGYLDPKCRDNGFLNPCIKPAHFDGCYTSSASMIHKAVPYDVFMDCVNAEKTQFSAPEIPSW